MVLTFKDNSKTTNQYFKQEQHHCNKKIFQNKCFKKSSISLGVSHPTNKISKFIIYLRPYALRNTCKAKLTLYDI